MGCFPLCGANVPPKRVPTRDYFAETPALGPDLRPRRTIVIGLKKCKQPTMYEWCSQIAPQRCGYRSGNARLIPVKHTLAAFH